MPSGYYDLYAEAGSLFVINLNFLNESNESANLGYTVPGSIGNTFYIPEELKTIGWRIVDSISAIMEIKKKPTKDATGSSIITFSTSGDGMNTTGKIELVNNFSTPNEPNIRIWKKEPSVSDVGTFFYDLELEFTGGINAGAGNSSTIKLRILQGRFTITPQVSL